MSSLKQAVINLGVSALLAMAMPSAEAVVLFDFNSLTDATDNPAANTAVQTYMNGATGLDTANTGQSVAVTGAKGEQNYNGEGHVVGPVNAQNQVQSVTLGTSDGYFPGAPGTTLHLGSYDTFLVNRSNTDRITMDFNFPIYSVAFDYEIFPNGSCTQQGSGTGGCQPTNSSWPDFTFETFTPGDVSDTVQFRTLGVVPGQGGTYPHSPNSGAVNNELAPQYVGVSGVWFFEDGVTKLEFIDWPVKIGIDNLQISDDECDVPGRCNPPPPPPVIPEPSSFLLLGSGLPSVLGLSSRSRRQ